MQEEVYDKEGNVVDYEPVYEKFERQTEDNGDGTQESIDIPNLSKGKRPRSIQLNDSMIEIYHEIIDWYENGYGSTLKDSGIHISKK